MRLKYSILAFFAICALSFSSCDFLLGNDDNNNSENNQGNNTPNTGGVAPLLKTTWGQGSPYRDLLPDQSRGGCVGVAIAQIMHFHRHPVKGNGQSEPYTSQGVVVPSVNFNEISFDWDNILDTYTTANPGTAEQRNAVAALFRYMAIGIGMHFGPDGTGGSVSAGPLSRGLVNFFGYDKNIQRLRRSWYDDATWEGLIREQLDAGLPVYYSGNNEANTSDHGFVIDGYDNEGKYHINWGWNGSHNGWYSLNALNPGNYNFNYGQAIFINLKPDEDGIGINELALQTFTVEKTTVRQNEQFNVTSNLYSTGFFSGGHVGAALVNNNNEIIEIIGMNSHATNGFNSLDPHGSRTSNISCYIPETINSGQYQLRIVIRPEGGSWQIVTLSPIGSIPNVINLTVNPYTGVNPGGGYGLSLERFNPDKVSVSHNEPFSVEVRTRKIGAEPFPGGRLGVALVNNKGEIAFIRDMNWNLQNPGSGYRGQTISNINIPNTVPQGQYQLMIVTRTTDGEWRIASLSRGDAPNTIDFEVK